MSLYTLALVCGCGGEPPGIEMVSRTGRSQNAAGDLERAQPAAQSLTSASHRSHLQSFLGLPQARQQEDRSQLVAMDP